jgi:hypothetical protein
MHAPSLSFSLIQYHHLSSSCLLYYISFWCIVGNKKLSLSLFSKKRRLKTRMEERTSIVCGESQADASEWILMMWLMTMANKEWVSAPWMGGWSNVIFFLETCCFQPQFFRQKLAFFSKSRCITLLQILHRVRFNSCLSNRAKIRVLARCTCPANTTQKSKTSDWLEWAQRRWSFKKTQQPLYHSIDRKRTIFHVIFGVG